MVTRSFAIIWATGHAFSRAILLPSINRLSLKHFRPLKVNSTVFRDRTRGSSNDQQNMSVRGHSSVT